LGQLNNLASLWVGFRLGAETQARQGQHPRQLGSSRRHAADAHIRPHADPAVRAECMRLIPMRRPGEVDEVAYAILFLASDESSYGSAPCPHRRCPEQDVDQSHSIPDNLVALFGAVGAWNCSAGNCGHTQQEAIAMVNNSSGGFI
jgi:hypothetical protein